MHRRIVPDEHIEPSHAKRSIISGRANHAFTPARRLTPIRLAGAVASFLGK